MVAKRSFLDWNPFNPWNPRLFIRLSPTPLYPRRHAGLSDQSFPGQAVFAEVHDEADFDVGGLHVGEGLSNVILGDVADRFQLLMFRAFALTLRVDDHF